MLPKPPTDFPVEWDYIQTLADGDHEFALELLQVFVQDLESQLPGLERAIEVQNLTKIYETAHYLKGASSNVGAKVMESLMRTLETQAKGGQLEGAEVLYATMSQYFQEVSAWVRSVSD